MEGLPDELALIPDKGRYPDHFMLGISDGIGDHISIESIRKSLLLFSQKFKNTGIRVGRFCDESHEQKEAILKSIIEQFYQCKLLQQKEYSDFYKEIIEIKEMFIQSSQNFIRKVEGG